MSNIDRIWHDVEKALDHENHERLCNCVPWNEGRPCVTYGELTPWSLNAQRAVELAAPVLWKEGVLEYIRYHWAHVDDDSMRELEDEFGTWADENNPYRLEEA